MLERLKGDDAKSHGMTFLSSKTMKQNRQENVIDKEEVKEYRMLCKAKDYIELHMADPITVSDIAYELGIGIKILIKCLEFMRIKRFINS